MEDCKLVAVNVTELEQANSELEHELSPLVSDDVIWESVVVEHILQI